MTIDPDLPLEVPLEGTRLHNQVHLDLDIGPESPLDRELTPQQFRTIGAITSLRCLRLQMMQHPQLPSLSFIFPTPFTRLVLRSFHPNKSFLRGFRIEGLRDLNLDCMRELGSDGVAALGRATGLTHLRLSYYIRGACVAPGEVGIALSLMSRLRALSLDSGEVPAPSCVKAIGLLTDLTSLKWAGKYLTNADVQAWLGLRKLRVLSITSQHGAPSDHRISADTFFVLVKLSELRHLSIRENFGSSP